MRTSNRFNWSWRRRAQCLGAPVDDYDLADLPSLRDRYGLSKTASRGGIAAALCMDCPVMRECAADALVDDPRPLGVVRGGVWCSPAGWADTARKLTAVVMGHPPRVTPDHYPVLRARRRAPVGATGAGRG